VRSILVLDSDGKRIAAKYYADEPRAALKDQLAFEKSLFAKTARANGIATYMRGSLRLLQPRL
jgi:hypothetical protein